MILAGSREFFAITGAADAQGRQFCSAAWPAAVNKRPTTAATAASLMTRRMVFRFRCSSLIWQRYWNLHEPPMNGSATGHFALLDLAVCGAGGLASLTLAPSAARPSPPKITGNLAMRSERRIADGPLYFMMSPAPPPVKLHRIENHQLYHHYLGDPIEVLMLHD